MRDSGSDLNEGPASSPGGWEAVPPLPDPDQAVTDASSPPPRRPEVPPPPPHAPPPPAPPPPPLGVSPAPLGGSARWRHLLFGERSPTASRPVVEGLSSYPSLVAAGAIVAGLALYWVGSVIAVVRGGNLGPRGRLLEVLGPGGVTWAAALLLGVALLARPLLAVGGSHQEDPSLRAWAQSVRLALLVGSVAVGSAAVVKLFVYLSLLGSRPDLAGTDFFQTLAAIPIAFSAAAWAGVLRTGSPVRG